MRTLLLIITCFSVNMYSHAYKAYTLSTQAEKCVLKNNESRIKNSKDNFVSFIKQFDLFNKKQFDKSFFHVRKERKTERYSPVLDNTEYSSFLSCFEIRNCKKDELYYEPCYRTETKQFIMLAINAVCDIPFVGHYPFESNILATYDKNGNIIDYEVIGSTGDVLYYKINYSKGFSELICTQYLFSDPNDGYSGKCNVKIYKFIINDNGIINKTLIKNYSDHITIAL